MSAFEAKHQRLKAMGVQPWYARLVLRGAGSSPSFVLKGEERKPTVAPGAEQSSSSTLDARFDQVAPHFLKIRASEPVPPKRPSSELAPSTLNNAETAPVEVSVPSIDLPQEQSIVAFGNAERLILCGKVTSDSFAQLSSLVSAIGSAFYLQNIRLTELASFTWPVFDSTALQSKSGEAQQRAFARFLRQLNKQSWSSVLLLGADLDSTQFTEVMGLDQRRCSVVNASVSPADCLRDPGQKAVLWRELLDAKSV